MTESKALYVRLAVLVWGALASSAVAQQAPQAPPPITMKMLKPDVWAALGGAGGNSTIIIGKTGVIVVDAKQTEAGAKDLLAQIAKITPKPVTTAIITHSDGDHVNGLVAFPAGIKIIAHENNKKEQQAALAAGGRGAPPADRLPTQVTTKTKEKMTIDGVKLELYHFAPAHTSGDLVIFLPEQKIVSTGDIVVTNRADDNPNVHFEKNGSTEGWLTSVKGMIALNADTYITGHGDLVTKADLQRKLAATMERRNKIAAMVKEGKTLEQIKAALPDAPAPGAPARGAGAAGGAPGAARGAGAAAAGGGRGGPAPKPPLTFVETAYQEITRTAKK
ncbi:MAG TPA: MBL fold metallo-hydrolase [Terriglobia bacterium]|jgi:glyoxylase-like metal-dependent hydrolase (beta-lactamase superfamily II)